MYEYIYDIFLAELFLELEMFQTKIRREKQNTRFMFNNFFFRKSSSLWNNVENFVWVIQARDGNIIGRMRIGCWVTNL